MATAELRNWSIGPHPTGVLIASGSIYGDTKGRFKDGEYVRTSAIVSIADGVVTTRNSSYTLDGAPPTLSLA